jgi:hypothetical protein
MNNTKALTKVLLAAMGIFFLIKTIPQIISSAIAVVIHPSLKYLWLVLIGLLITSAAIFLLWYFFFHRREWLAEKIVGPGTNYEPGSHAPWFPPALRLSCIFAGLYCLYSAAWHVTQIINLLSWYVERGVTSRTVQSPLSEVVGLSLILAAGIYLLCGAPHFVRWQVKKTFEQCRSTENSGKV